MSLIVRYELDKLIRLIDRIYRNDPQTYYALLWQLRGAQILIEPTVDVSEIKKAKARNIYLPSFHEKLPQQDLSGRRNFSMPFLLQGPPGTGKSSMIARMPVETSLRKACKIPDDKNGYILNVSLSQNSLNNLDNMMPDFIKSDKDAYVTIIFNEFSNDDSKITIMTLPKIK